MKNSTTIKSFLSAGLLGILFYACQNTNQSPSTLEVPKVKNRDTSNQETDVNNYNKSIAFSDTAEFYLTKSIESKLFAFQDSNLYFKKYGIQLALINSESDSYSFSLKRDSETVYKEEKVQGISKIWLNDNFLCFSLYSFYNEDGQNEGVPVLYSLADKTLKIGKEILPNLSNPIIVDSITYVISELSLIKLDLHLKNISELPIFYFERNLTDPYFRYLDTYGVCGLSSLNNQLSIYFTPNRSKAKCMLFKGVIKEENSKIVLRN